MLDILLTVLVGIWVFVPALLPNSAAVVFGGGTPMDFGKSMGGERILGDGKTWRGFFGGGLSGVAVGLVMIGVSMLAGSEDGWGFGPLPGALSVLFCLSFGSLLGDILGSFLKRRFGVERGGKAPILDQYDFVIGAFLLAMAFRWDWVMATYVDGYGWLSLIALLVLVPLLHRAVNIIGYRSGLKDEPW
ncbi:MAG: CDP-2,3-bis-(O-geranylgeranyl)-sn-glycerol synthase [Thermoplasmatales archaeon]|nr:CDP-2,3-bis-(O-geranylgeranyl)-sn-glycerol synthase [Thermoplasmatales archaeon]